MEELLENEFLSEITYFDNRADMMFRFSDTTPELQEVEVARVICKKIYSCKINYNQGIQKNDEKLFSCYIGEVNHYRVENKSFPSTDLAKITDGFLSNSDVPIDGNFSVLVMDVQITVAVACKTVEIVRCLRAAKVWALG